MVRASGEAGGGGRGDVRCQGGVEGSGGGGARLRPLAPVCRRLPQRHRPR